MDTHRIPLRSILVLPLVAGLALAGCDAADQDAEDADDADTLATLPQDDTAAAARDATTAGQGDTVEVRLTDFAIEMPMRLPAGPTTFHVMNAGQAEHNFEVEGQGIEQELESNLAAGDTATMQLDLEPGTYTVYCPVGDHEDRGMRMELTVGDGATAP